MYCSPFWKLEFWDKCTRMVRWGLSSRSQAFGYDLTWQKGQRISLGTFMIEKPLFGVKKDQGTIVLDGTVLWVLIVLFLNHSETWGSHKYSPLKGFFTPLGLLGCFNWKIDRQNLEVGVTWFWQRESLS